MRFSTKVKWCVFDKRKGSYLPRSSPSRSSLLTAPTPGDERRGSWGAYRTFSAKPKKFSPSPRSEEGWGREKWAGRRINEVGELLLSRESILMDLHFFWWFCVCFHHFDDDVFVLSSKRVLVYVKTMYFLTFFIILKIVNCPIKSGTGTRGGGGSAEKTNTWIFPRRRDLSLSEWLSRPFRSRFSLQCQMEVYSQSQIVEWVSRIIEQLSQIVDKSLSAFFGLSRNVDKISNEPSSVPKSW